MKRIAASGTAGCTQVRFAARASQFAIVTRHTHLTRAEWSDRVMPLAAGGDRFDSSRRRGGESHGQTARAVAAAACGSPMTVATDKRDPADDGERNASGVATTAAVSESLRVAEILCAGAWVLACGPIWINLESF